VTRVLLDTHVLLWILIEPERLSPTARRVLENATAPVLFSSASIWEIAIKAQRRRADFGVSPARIADAAITSGFEEVVISSTVAARVADLPLHHRDPFDRLLVAQALDLPARLLTADGQLEPYSELVTRID
jgi:PIN domain nuclease of toxin-antitoxin system